MLRDLCHRVSPFPLHSRKPAQGIWVKLTVEVVQSPFELSFKTLALALNFRLEEEDPGLNPGNHSLHRPDGQEELLPEIR